MCIRDRNNLAKENNLTEIDSNLLENELENKFYEQITSIENRAFQSSEDYKQELKNVADTAIVGNDYLDNTMINVEDEAVKNNRLAMLNNLSQRIKKVFDINQIVK